MQSNTRSDMKNYSSDLFHNILNPLTVLSLEIDHQHTTTPKLQNQVDTMLHYLTHLEYFVSMLCENVKQHFFYKQISVNTEIQNALEIIGYSAKQKNIQIISIFLSEVSLETNQLHFHQMLLELLHVFLFSPEPNPSHNQKIELTLQKKKTHFSICFSLTEILYDTNRFTQIQKKFEKNYSTTFQIKQNSEKSIITLKFPTTVTSKITNPLDE